MEYDYRDKDNNIIEKKVNKITRVKVETKSWEDNLRQIEIESDNNIETIELNMRNETYVMIRFYNEEE